MTRWILVLSGPLPSAAQLTLCSLGMRCLRGPCLPGMGNTATMVFLCHTGRKSLKSPSNDTEVVGLQQKVPLGVSLRWNTRQAFGLGMRVPEARFGVSC